MLEIFDRDLPIKIYTDASLKGIGAVLKQTQDNGNEKSVAYFSKKLNEAQRKKRQSTTNQSVWLLRKQ